MHKPNTTQYHYEPKDFQVTQTVKNSCGPEFKAKMHTCYKDSSIYE